MTRCVFRSGFVWKVIEYKWPGFEAAFGGFDVTGCAMLGEEDPERLAADERIVRHAAKIRSVPRNAAFILDVRREHGGFGAFLAGWPGSDIVGLWDELKRRGDRLGGQTGRFFLRMVGKDTPVLSRDVVAALRGQGVIDKEPTSRKALARVQEAFDVWREESGRDLCQISGGVQEGGRRKSSSPVGASQYRMRSRCRGRNFRVVGCCWIVRTRWV